MEGARGGGEGKRQQHAEAKQPHRIPEHPREEKARQAAGMRAPAVPGEEPRLAGREGIGRGTIGPAH